MKKTFFTITLASLSMIGILLMGGCQQNLSSLPANTQEAQQANTQAPTTTAVTAEPTATTFPLPVAEYIQTQESHFSIAVNQPFALRRNQQAAITGTDISLRHTTDIEFECPSDQNCETALIAFDYITMFQGETIIHEQEWAQNMHIGDYIITTAQMWHDDDYEEHGFEIVLNVQHQETVRALEEARTADPEHIQISTNCSEAGIDDVSHYFATEKADQELHVFGIYKASQDRFDLSVERSTKVPIILFLSANDATEWHIETADEVEIASIILNGRGAHTISGIETENIPTIDKTGLSNSFAGYMTKWSGDMATHNNGLSPAWRYKLEAFTGTKIASFTGCYTASEATLR